MSSVHPRLCHDFGSVLNAAEAARNTGKNVAAQQSQGFHAASTRLGFAEMIQTKGVPI